MASVFTSTCKVTPDRGIVTFDSEGTEGGKWHSRRLHVPTDASGLTLGRGYDMRTKNPGQIVNDLTKAGVDLDTSRVLSSAVGLKGDDAKEFISDEDLEEFEIDPCTQRILFDITYDAEAREARRICEKADVTAQYGKCDWDHLDPAIRDIVVDLKYRGDFTPHARTILQKFIVAKDLEGFTKVLSDRSNWVQVPDDRFGRRKSFLKTALAGKKTKEKMDVKFKAPS
jgi:hypothetical protein